MADRKRDAIGVLDSGVGGLSVLREIQKLLPHENLYYFADQAHIPYGTRSLDEIRHLSTEITRYLLAQGAKIVVVACNTASAAALYHLRRSFPEVSFVGMEPAVKPAAQLSRSGVIAVLATPATFQGELFASLVERYGKRVRVIEQICPHLVQQVEAGELDTPATMALLHEYLDPLLAQRTDVVVLGCTHYPFLSAAIQDVLGTAARIVDPSEAVARQTQRVLMQRGWLNLQQGQGELICVTSGEAAGFAALAGRLIGGCDTVSEARWDPAGGGLSAV